MEFFISFMIFIDIDIWHHGRLNEISFVLQTRYLFHLTPSLWKFFKHQQYAREKQIVIQFLHSVVLFLL